MNIYQILLFCMFIKKNKIKNLIMKYLKEITIYIIIIIMSIINIIKNNKNININIYNCKKCCSDDVDDDEELFKPIDGFDNYSISNFGNVKNSKTNRILKPGNDKKGYKLINLSKNGKSKSFTVHRLVGNAFLENPDNKQMIDHIDENKANNNIKNLRWATRKDNGYNRGKNINNKSGFKGVCFHKPSNKYIAQININGKTKHLGLFKTAEEASKAYDTKAKVIHKEFYYKNK